MKFFKTKGLVLVLMLLSLTVFLFATYVYQSAEALGNIVDLDIDQIESIEMQLEFGWESKVYSVGDREAITSIIEIVNALRVKPSHLDTPTSYAPFHKKNYTLYINGKQGNTTKPVYISIVNKTYVKVNGESYTSIGPNEVEQLYKITILAQDPSTIDDYYFDLIDGP